MRTQNITAVLVLLSGLFGASTSQAIADRHTCYTIWVRPTTPDNSCRVPPEGAVTGRLRIDETAMGNYHSGSPVWGPGSPTEGAIAVTLEWNGQAEKFSNRYKFEWAQGHGEFKIFYSPEFPTAESGVRPEATTVDFHGEDCEIDVTVIPPGKEASKFASSYGRECEP